MIYVSVIISNEITFSSVNIQYKEYEWVNGNHANTNKTISSNKPVAYPNKILVKPQQTCTFAWNKL